MATVTRSFNSRQSRPADANQPKNQPKEQAPSPSTDPSIKNLDDFYANPMLGFETSSFKARLRSAIASSMRSANASASEDPKKELNHRVDDFMNGLRLWTQTPDSSFATLKAKRVGMNSIATAVVKVAASGLTLDPFREHAWITPKSSRGTFYAVPMPGVRGLETKVFGGKLLSGIVANEVVRQQDVFRHRMGTRMEVEHERNFSPDPTKPNAIICAYAVGRTATGELMVSVWPRDPEMLKEALAQNKSGRMDADSAVRLRARRQLLREAINTLGNSPDMDALNTMMAEGESTEAGTQNVSVPVQTQESAQDESESADEQEVTAPTI